MKMPEVDTAMFNGPFGEIVNELDPYTEGSKVGVLATLMSAFSGYLGHNTQVKTSTGPMPLMFWPVLIGTTGARKGKATGIAMQVVNQAFSAWSTSNVVYGCPATGLGYLQVLAGRCEEGGVARPVMFIEEEMDAFITNARKDSRVGTMLRKSWDGADLAHQTANDDITVKDTHISWVGHCQPPNWGAISGSRDATGGTYNRYFPLAVEQSKAIPVFGGPDPTDVITEQGRRLRSLARDAREVDMVTVTADVAAVFEAKHRPACDALIAGNEELAQMSERAMAYLVRLAALYALIDSRDEIELEDFDAALALVRYSVDTVVNVLPAAGGDRISTMIAEALKKHGEMSRMELWDLVGRNKVTARDISDALLILPQVQEKTVPTKGRPCTVYTWIEETETADEDKLSDVAA